jgi:stage IV sporulation protein FB
MLFQSLPPTRYDLNFSIAGIPVRVHPLFWLVALFLGSSGDLLLIPIWIIVVFISVLIHELGHALAFRRYGLDSHILLHFMGGLTVPEAAPWGRDWANVSPDPGQQILISLAGPFAGFFLATLVFTGVIVSGGTVLTAKLFGLIPIPLSPILPFGGRVLGSFVALMLWVNLFWGLINLVPVFPLDGGQVARNVLLKYDPRDGLRKSLWVSVIAGGIVALASLFFLGSIFMAVLFGILAYQSYRSLNV